MSFAPLRYAVILAIVFAAIAGMTLLPGRLSVTGHELDMIQMLDIAYRMVEGDRPHVDFMTPLGVLGFLPVVLFLEQGYGPGLSFLLAQLLVTAILLPAIWWVGISRMTGGVRIIYGVGMVVLATALIFGADNPSLTVSMFYNRWAWVIASFLILLTLLPPRAGWNSAVVDGVLIGLSGVALVLIKLTFAMGLAPMVLLALLYDRAWARLGAATMAALAGLAAATVSFGGIGFWQTYAGDLIGVSRGTMRQYPGLDLFDLMTQPAQLPMSVLLLLTVIFWRNAGRAREGLLLLVLIPGLVWIVYQNWGNDPKWLFLLGLMLLALPPRPPERPIWGTTALGVSRVLAIVAFVLYAPSMITLATSTPRHMVLSEEGTVPIFADLSRQDIRVKTAKSYLPVVERIERNLPVPEGLDEAELPPEPIEVGGEIIEECSLSAGMNGWTDKAVAQLGAVEEAVGSRILVADVYDHLWLFGPFERLQGMAPWYYGTEDGIDSGQYLMVPYCAISTRARRGKIESVKVAGWELEEVIRTDLFILFRREG